MPGGDPHFFHLLTSSFSLSSHVEHHTMRIFRYLVPILVVLSWVTCFPPQDLPDILDLQDAQALQNNQDLQETEVADRTHKKNKAKKKKKKGKVCLGPDHLDPDYINEHCTPGIVCVVLPKCAYSVEVPGDHHCKGVDEDGNGRGLCRYKTNYFRSEDDYAFFKCDGQGFQVGVWRSYEQGYLGMGIDNHLSTGYVDAYFRKNWLKVWTKKKGTFYLAPFEQNKGNPFIIDIKCLWPKPSPHS